MTYEFDSLGGAITRNPRRRRNTVVEVYAHNQLDNAFHKYQELAWKYLTTRVTSIERAVTKKHWPTCLENFKARLSAIPDTDKTWKAIRGKEAWDDKSVLKKQISITSISLCDTEIDGHGVITLDFEVGWDEEHGVSILMCRNKVIAASGSADFTGRGKSLLGHAKCIQDFSYSEGDLRI